MAAVNHLIGCLRIKMISMVFYKYVLTCLAKQQFRWEMTVQIKKEQNSTSECKQKTLMGMS